MSAMGAHLEEALESTIEEHPLAHGWHQGANTSYNRGLAVDTSELFTFVSATQIAAWEKLVARHGGDRGSKHQVKMTKPGERPITLPENKRRAYSKGFEAALRRQAGL